MNKSKSIYWVILAMAPLQLAFSQSDLPDEKVEIVKNYRANIAKARSITLHPSTPQKSDEGKYNYEYVVSPSEVEIKYDPPKLKPKLYYQEELKEDYRVFVRGGYGTPHSPLFNGSLNWRSDDETFGIHLDGLHHSANKKSLEHQRFSKSGLNLQTDYYTNSQLIIKSGVSYLAQDAYLFGYDHELESFAEIDAKRNINRIKVNLSVENKPALDETLRYSVGGSFLKLNDDLGMSETNYLLNAFVAKNVMDNIDIGAKLDGRFINPIISELDALTNIQFRPFVNYKSGIINVHGGINIATNKGTKIYPDVAVEVSLLEDKVSLLAGWKGGLGSNSFSNLLERNPYLQANPSSLISTAYNEIYGGLRGNYGGFIFETKLGYESVDNFAVYLASEDDSRFFNVLYDDGNILRASVNISKPILNKGNVYANLRYNRYNLDNQEYAWHHPNTDIEVGASWKMLQEALSIKGFTTLRSGAPVRILSGEFVRLNSLTDISLQADYFVTQNFGVFSQANNLLNRKHEQWLNYPSYGLNFYGGILARF